MNDSDSTNILKRLQQVSNVPSQSKSHNALDRLAQATGCQAKIVIALDVSGSMSSGTKFKSSIRGIKKYYQDAVDKGYEVVLILFADDIGRYRDNIVDMIESYDDFCDKYFSGGTSADPISPAADILLQKPYREKIICVVTDGEWFHPEVSIAAAQKAKAQNIDIMAIGTDDANKEFLDMLVSKHELSQKVQSAQLEQAISNASLSLPRLK